jgi:hypothetical protein
MKQILHKLAGLTSLTFLDIRSVFQVIAEFVSLNMNECAFADRTTLAILPQEIRRTGKIALCMNQYDDREMRALNLDWFEQGPCKALSVAAESNSWLCFM